MSFSAGVPFQEKHKLMEKYSNRPKKFDKDTTSKKSGNIKSEYHDKYVRWDLVDGSYKPVIALPPKDYSPIVPIGDRYELAMNVANWNSEQKSQYVKKESNVQYGDALPAGSSSSDGEHFHSPYQTSSDVSIQDNNAIDSSSARNRYRTNWPSSEYNAQYHPKESQPTAPTPRPSNRAPYVLDDDYNADGTFWNSEYDIRCAELRKRQHTLLAATSSDPVAGKASQAHVEAPHMYAWVEQQIGFPAPPVPAATSKASVVVTEYNRQYHSESDKAGRPTIHTGRPNSLDLFEVEGDNFEELGQSVYQQSFPAHPLDVTAGAGPTPDGNPKHFAWDRLDGKPAVTSRVNRTGEKDPLRSEYSQHYIGGSAARTSSIRPADMLDLFYEDPAAAADDEDDKAIDRRGGRGPSSSSSFTSAQSKYDDVYSTKSTSTKQGGGNKSTKQASPAAGIPSPVKTTVPYKFAWALSVDDGTQADARANPLVQNEPSASSSQSSFPKLQTYSFPPNLASEYDSRYRKFDGERTHLAPDRTSSIQELLSLDVEQAGVKTTHMVSQYDLQCARLQEKLQAIASKVSPPQEVAGVKSARRDVAPTYYVWEDKTTAEAKKDPLPGKGDFADDLTLISEYGNQYVPLGMCQRAARVDRSSLNLFSAETTVESTEYDDNFTAHGDDVDYVVESPRSRTRLKNVTNHEATGVTTPHNFAWPYNKQPHARTPETKEAMVSHEGYLTDYDRNFRWVQTEATVARGKVNATLLPCGRPAPMALDVATDCNHTPSEESKGGAEQNQAIAGVLSSKDSPRKPNNFAWRPKKGICKPSADAVAGSQVLIAKKLTFPTPHTEYNDMFKPVLANYHPVVVVDRSSLNLFG